MGCSDNSCLLGNWKDLCTKHLLTCTHSGLHQSQRQASSCSEHWLGHAVTDWCRTGWERSNTSTPSSEGFDQLAIRGWRISSARDHWSLQQELHDQLLPVQEHLPNLGSGRVPVPSPGRWLAVVPHWMVLCCRSTLPRGGLSCWLATCLNGRSVSWISFGEFSSSNN